MAGTKTFEQIEVATATGDRTAIDAAFAATRQRIQQQTERARIANGLIVKPGSWLGPQVVFGETPTPASFQPVSMTAPLERGMRPLNAAFGGLWSSTLTEDGSSTFIDGNLAAGGAIFTPWLLKYYSCFRKTGPHNEPAKPWVVHPDPATRIVVVEDESSYQAALHLFRYGDSIEIDAAKVRDAGFAAIHVTARGVAECQAMWNWQHESTHWLTWAFVGETYTSTLPSRVTQILDSADSVGPHDAAGRFYFSGLHRGSWAVFGELPSETLHQAAKLLHLHHRGARSVTESNVILASLTKVLIETWIIEHNLTGDDDKPLPVGGGLFKALGLGKAIMLMDQWGGYEACRQALEKKNALTS